MKVQPGTRGGKRGSRPEGARGGALADLQDRVLDVARRLDWAGYSKHDALNAPWLEKVAGGFRLSRLLAIQLVMRSPLHVRPWLGVARARNPKGIALFSRALLSRTRLLEDEDAAREAEALLDWLLEHPAGGFEDLSWGYPYPWQDVGFFAPRGFPNRVVTANVVEALLDGYETLGRERYLDAAGGAVRFLVEAPRTLYEDADRRCVSYVPSGEVTWIVMDVSALAGAAAARYAAFRGDEALLDEAGRLVRYVASKQTDEGAWYYSDPPEDSHITHDNYHTGVILDAILSYERAAGGGEFAEAYRRGLEFYRRRLFEPGGAPRFMSDRRYPYDVHGAAQGVLTFSRASAAPGDGRGRGAGSGGAAEAVPAAGVDQDEAREMATRVLRWTLEHLYDPETGWFDYQKRRFFRTRVRLLRWCQAWMAHALGVYMEAVGASHEGGAP